MVRHRPGEAGTTIHDRIERDPKEMLGTPVIRGTRIPVELILRKLAERATEADLLDACPHLTRAGILAARACAADAIAHEETVVVEPTRGPDSPLLAR